MPFVSKAQQRYLHWAKPKGVNLKKWDKQTDFSKLPEKAKKKASLIEVALEKRANILNLVYPVSMGALLGGATGGLAGMVHGNKEDALQGAITGATAGGSLGLLKNVARNKILWNKLSPGSEDLAELVLRQKNKVPLSNREEFVNLLEKIPLATAAGGYVGYKSSEQPEKGFWA